MRKILAYAAVAVALLVTATVARGKHDDDEKRVREAVKRCTLNQKGTKRFHLRAEFAPTYAGQRGSNRTGEVEIWWASPTRWKREVSTLGFHQVAIVNGRKEWQKNDGDYFPEWLRVIYVALVSPAPNLDEVLTHVREAKANGHVRTSYSWTEVSGDGKVEKEEGAGFAITAKGLVYGGLGLGWNGYYKDYEDFHGRMVARTVRSGSPEVTAKIVVLEDLGKVRADFFDAKADGSDPVIRTAVIGEMDLRKNQVNEEPVVWPPVKDGPLEGVVTTQVSVDRAGRVREVGDFISDNPAINAAAEKAIKEMQFKPYLQDGAPVQVVSRITMGFKAERPEGAEKFESARHYFELVRQASFPSAPGGQPYILHATFQVMMDGNAEEGQYVDTWENAQAWKREVTLGDTHVVRAQHGETRSESAGGSQLKVLRMVVMRSLEPLPMLLDNFYEADWRIKRDKVDGVDTIRVMAGYEAPDGSFDPEMTRGYWFDEKGRLLRTYLSGLETKRLDFASFGQKEVAQEIQVLRDGKLEVLIHVTEIKSAGDLPESTFVVDGRQYKSTSDTR